MLFRALTTLASKRCKAREYSFQTLKKKKKEIKYRNIETLNIETSVYFKSATDWPICLLVDTH